MMQRSKRHTNIYYNTVRSELCECNEQTHSRQCCNILISWLVNIGDVFIEAWLLVWLARPICQRLCRTLCTLTPDKLSAVSYDLLTHSRHNAGDSRSWNKDRTNMINRPPGSPPAQGVWLNELGPNIWVYTHGWFHIRLWIWTSAGYQLPRLHTVDPKVTPKIG